MKQQRQLKLNTEGAADINSQDAHGLTDKRAMKPQTVYLYLPSSSIGSLSRPAGRLLCWSAVVDRLPLELFPTHHRLSQSTSKLSRTHPLKTLRPESFVRSFFFTADNSILVKTGNWKQLYEYFCRCPLFSLSQLGWSRCAFAQSPGVSTLPTATDEASPQLLKINCNCAVEVMTLITASCCIIGKSTSFVGITKWN